MSCLEFCSFEGLEGNNNIKDYKTRRVFFTFITTTQKQGSKIQSKLLLVLSEHSGSANPTIGVISDLSFHLIKDDLGVAL